MRIHKSDVAYCAGRSFKSWQEIMKVVKELAEHRKDVFENLREKD